MAMRGGKISLATVRMRMERLEERTTSTVLPPIEDLFRTMDPDQNLTKALVESMTFSNYSGAKQATASALKGMLGNTKNLKDLRESGFIGSLLEVIRRTDVKNEPRTQHVENLVTSLYTLLENDSDMMERLVAHPFGVKTVIRLCKYTENRLQAMCFDMLEWVHAQGPHVLLQLDILKVLLHPIFMYKKTTTVDVRHRAAHMIALLTPYSPSHFNVDIFNKLLVDPDAVDSNGKSKESGGVGRRRIDGYMEMQLLSSFLCHMSWRDRHSKGPLNHVLTIVAFLISEVKAESFETVEHMQQIMRILVVLSSDYKHADYMWNNSLGSALQYLVRTDFSLFRKKSGKSTGSQEEEKRKIAELRAASKASGASKRKSILDTGERDASTLMFMNIIKPTTTGASRNEDINLFCTRYVAILYENIMNIKIEIIHDLVSTGIVGAFLLRVGSGSDRDPRFNKIVSHFIHQLLLKVMVNQSHKGYHLAFLRLVKTNSGNEAAYTEHSGGNKDDRINHDKEELEAEKKKLRLFVGRGQSSPSAAEMTPCQLANFLDPVIIEAHDLDPKDTNEIYTKVTGMPPPRPTTSSRPGTQQQQSRGTTPNSTAPNKDLSLTIPDSRPKSGPGKPNLTVQIGSPSASMNEKKNQAGLTPGPGFRKKLAISPIRDKGQDGQPYNYAEMNSDSREGSPEPETMNGFDTLADLGDSMEWGDSFADGSIDMKPSSRKSNKRVKSVTMGEAGESAEEAHKRRALAQSIDVRSISNTLTAQGVVENFFQTLNNSHNEDSTVVKESINCLAILNFGSYWHLAVQGSNLDALFKVSRARQEYFYGFLSIMIEMINSSEVPNEILERLIVENKCISILVRALNMSAWVFHRKEDIYRCFSKLAFSDNFMINLRDAQGISVLCREVLLRKLKARQNQRAGDSEGDGTPKLLGLLKKDIATIKIQSQVRRKCSNKKLAKSRKDAAVLQAALDRHR
jgi:hypothetical protein